MSIEPLGKLAPIAGGEAIQLTNEVMTVGRCVPCDIILASERISSLHATLSFRNGFWHVRDHNSTNGTRVNGVAVVEKWLYPGDEIAFSKHKYTIDYVLSTYGSDAHDPPPSSGPLWNPRF